MFKLLVPLIMVLLNTPTMTEKPTLQIATIEIGTPQIEYEIYEVTAYTANFESTGKHPDHPEYGITASGARVQENHTIACGKDLAFGTQVYIPYFDNVFTCEDRGGAITTGKIDVYMESLDDALSFGRRQLEVQILD